MHIDSAPCHAYHPLLGSGLEWEPGRVKLWIGGEVVATAVHTTASAREFFYNLAFVECFPDVAAWWVRSEWVGRIRVSAPEDPGDGEGLAGFIQFDHADTPGLLWTVADDAPVTVAVPVPPCADHHANLFLRLRLARMVLDTLGGHVPVDKWQGVSAAVARADIEALLPAMPEGQTISLPRRLTALVDDRDVAGRVLAPRRWVLADMPDAPARKLLVSLLGLDEQQPG